MISSGSYSNAVSLKYGEVKYSILCQVNITLTSHIEQNI